MDIIKELNTPVIVPDYASILDKFPRAAIARKMGLSYSYVSNVLRGLRTPGKKTDKKFRKLAEKIQQEMEQ